MTNRNHHGRIPFPFLAIYANPAPHYRPPGSRKAEAIFTYLVVQARETLATSRTSLLKIAHR